MMGNADQSYMQPTVVDGMCYIKPHSCFFLVESSSPCRASTRRAGEHPSWNQFDHDETPAPHHQSWGELPGDSSYHQNGVFSLTELGPATHRHSSLRQWFMQYHLRYAGRPG